jgi:hypothetical protein
VARCRHSVHYIYEDGGTNVHTMKSDMKHGIPAQTSESRGHVLSSKRPGYRASSATGLTFP